MADAERTATADDAGAERAARFLVTVGVPLGLTFDPESSEKKGMVRHGRDLLNMDLDAYQVLFGAVRPVTREALAGWASDNRGIADPEGVIDRCLDAGLLLWLDFASHQDELWPTLRLQPIGIGNGPDAKGECEIRLPDRKPAIVDGFAYTFWAASDGRSIQEVAEFLSVQLKMDRVGTIIMVPLTLFRLLGGGAAYLDKAP